jgi:mannose-6-phosphate isomerase-like protein (cupin superfamily)
MDVQGKIWGSTSPLFCKNNVEIHRIEGNKGGFCSWHKHGAKYNRFFVESGTIKVTVQKDYGSGTLEDVTILLPGQQTTVAPGDYHKFEVLEDCVAYEIYWVELNPADIERITVGGYNEEENKKEEKEEKRPPEQYHRDR